jgi:hypothetical protein
LFDGYDVLTANFSKSMIDQLFRYDVSEIETISANDLEADLRRFKEQHAGSWLSKYLKSYGLYHLLQRTQIETVKGVIENLSSDRMKAWRIVREMEKLQFETMHMRTVAPSIRPLSELYNELRGKVLEEPLRLVA